MSIPREIIADRYELLEVIGQGGQALVFRAHDKETSRDVAVKIVNKTASNDAEWVERMAREQQAMVALAGTSAVGFIDLCSSSTGALCLVMELLEGTDLEGYLKEKDNGATRLPVDEVVRLMTPIVDTLEKAHAVGIVHRDLKPGNVFVPRDGGTRLLDFGFSRSKTSRHVTATGTILGSPSYIAPEMWLSRSDKVDHRVDVYALGVMLFRLIGGELPFKGDTLQQKFIAVTTAERPSLHALRQDLSQDVDIWVERVLSIDPEDRFPSVRASFGELMWALGLAPHPREQKSSEPESSSEVRRIREWLEAPFSALPNTFNAAMKLAKGALQRLKRLAFAVPELPPAARGEPEAKVADSADAPASPNRGLPGETISEVLAWAGDASGTRPTLLLDQESEAEAEIASFLAHAPTVTQSSEPPAAVEPAREPPMTAMTPLPSFAARSPGAQRLPPELAFDSTVLDEGAHPLPANDIPRRRPALAVVQVDKKDAAISRVQTQLATAPNQGELHQDGPESGVKLGPPVTELPVAELEAANPGKPPTARLAKAKVQRVATPRAAKATPRTAKATPKSAKATAKSAKATAKGDKATAAKTAKSRKAAPVSPKARVAARPAPGDSAPVKSAKGGKKKASPKGSKGAKGAKTASGAKTNVAGATRSSKKPKKASARSTASKRTKK
jgi:eukaryotic-like serine/threonine-protein kinase